MSGTQPQASAYNHTTLDPDQNRPAPAGPTTTRTFPWARRCSTSGLWSNKRARELAQRWRSTGGLVVAKHGADLKTNDTPEETAPASSAPLAVGAAAHHGASRPGRRRPPQPRAEIQVRLCRSISRLPVRSGRGGENEGHGATRTVGPGSDGERTERWRGAAGEIGGLE